MVTLTYRARSRAVGHICSRIARASNGIIQAIPDDHLPLHTDGTVVRWGSWQEGGADQVINSPQAVLLSRDKRGSRGHLRGLCPRTWIRRYDIMLPCIVRPRHHYGGSRFFVCLTDYQMRQAINMCGKGWYASEIFPKTHEYRVLVLQGYVVRVSERFPGNAEGIPWNVTAGGFQRKLSHDVWPPSVIQTAISATECLGLDWGAVDLATDVDGRVVIFEVNTAPGITNPRAVTRLVQAFTWADMHPHTPREPAAKETWKTLLHPALLH